MPTPPPPILPPTQASALDYFRLLVADDESFALLEAAIAVGQDDAPGLDVTTVMATVDDWAQRLRRRWPADASATQRLRLLCQFFFRELGFEGNVNDYYAVDNSHLHKVIETRRGIPITLALLLMELGAQQGLKMAGISFPGHFLVKCSLPQGEVVIDPFSGRSLAREELDERLQPYRVQQGLIGEFDVPLGLFLQPAQPRDILARLLRNLKEIHRTAEDWDRLKPVMDRLVCVLPQDWSERRDRALVLAELGHWAAAAADLEQYLAHQSSADDALPLAERLVELRRLAAASLS